MKNKIVLLLSFIIFPLSLFGCSDLSNQCNIVDRFVFEADNSKITLQQGGQASLTFRFYPIPGSRLRYNSDQLESFVIRSTSHDVQIKKLNLNDRKSSIIDREVTEGNPILVAVPIALKKDATGLKLKFAEFGEIRVIDGDRVVISLQFYPVIQCVSDSVYDYTSEFVTIAIEDHASLD